MANFLAFGWGILRHYNSINCEFSVGSQKLPKKMGFDLFQGGSYRHPGWAAQYNPITLGVECSSSCTAQSPKVHAYSVSLSRSEAASRDENELQ